VRVFFLLLAGCSTTEAPPSSDPTGALEALIRIPLASDSIGEVEVLAIEPRSEGNAFERPGPFGRVSVRWQGDEVITEGLMVDPRFSPVERFAADGTITVEPDESASRDLLVVLDVPPSGSGTLEVLASAIDGSDLFRTFELSFDIGSRAEGIRSSALDSSDPIHVGGATASRGRALFVFMPRGYEDLDAFVERARRFSSELLASDWFEDHTSEMSFYALRSAATNVAGRPGCGQTAAAPAHARGWLAARNENYGGAERSPDVRILLVADCPDYIGWAASGVVTVSSDAPYDSLAHEIGHAFGSLADEYSVEGPIGTVICAGNRLLFETPNVAHRDDLPWECIRPGRAYAENCHVFQSVDAYGPVCGEDRVRPCDDCAMTRSTERFCPVCRRTLDMQLRRARGITAAETCNGADDDGDGDTDEGCECSATCRDDGEPCSGSGPAFDAQCCEGSICVVGACRPNAGGRERAPCTEEAMCASGLACRPVSSPIAAPTCCARASDYCETKADCCGLMDCFSNQCIARVTGDSCILGDCAEGSYCEDGLCR
jgi:hypothetical protein